MQIFHVIVDGLYDSVPILLSFMIVAFGAQEKDAGSSCRLRPCWVRWRAWARRAVRSGSVFAYAVPDHRRVRRGVCGEHVSQNIWFSGFFFVIAMMGYGVFHNAAFSYLTVRTERSMLGKVLGTSRP
ncbi:MAG: hypothetical protein ACLRWP_15975 [Bilophila wadsworthia]